ncbi:(2Fe-2S)-binding protein [Desulfobacterales bacterium HSG2]|nr:(2Fe-2S)-binding protein [Desulfobacterales bacterium HSG2]
MEINLRVNDQKVAVHVSPLKRLIDVLREDLRLKGVKEGCGEGECGACAVILNGELANACLIPAGMLENANIRTIEGIRETKRGEYIIEAFAAEGSVQCGFCTPGMVVAAEWLLSGNPRPDEKAIREGISGNLCRCTGYDMIVRGIRTAAIRGRGLW